MLEGRRFGWRLVVLLSATALIMAACGNDEEELVTPDEPDEEVVEEEFSVALLLPGSVTDEGYNADGERTANMIESELGAEVTFTEGVDVAAQADVYRQFAAQDFDLVIGWGGQFTDGAVEVAEEFPEVNFLIVNSGASNGSNLASMDTAVEQWQFLGGYVLARLSESGVVGWVGGGCFPATAANLHGTEQGAIHANPDIEFLSTFTGDFEDPTAARQAATAMIEQGADALSGNLNNGWFGIFEAARESGNLPVVTEWEDNRELAPEVITTSIVKSQARFVVELAEQAREGTLAGEFHMFELPEDWGEVIPATELLPDELAQETFEVQEQIIAGEVTVERDESCPGD